MSIKPKNRIKKMTIFLGAMALLFALWVVYYEARRMLYPPQPEVVDLCDPADKTLSEQAAKQCRWVIPAKYVSVRLEQSKGRYFEARVPWIDIDPDYAFDPKNTVTFQFWLDGSDYASGIRWKNQHIGANVPDKNGVLRISSPSRDKWLYFEGFDGVEAYVRGVPSFSMPLPHGRIYRPFSLNGDMHWMVPFPPNLQSQEAMDSYVQHNIKEMDRKLMQFISQWH
jgi:hypothetical protein